MKLKLINVVYVTLSVKIIINNYLKYVLSLVKISM
jgi:hypothetical protein